MCKDAGGAGWAAPVRIECDVEAERERRFEARASGNDACPTQRNAGLADVACITPSQLPGQLQPHSLSPSDQLALPTHSANNTLQHTGSLIASLCLPQRARLWNRGEGYDLAAVPPSSPSRVATRQTQQQHVCLTTEFFFAASLAYFHKRQASRPTHAVPRASSVDAHAPATLT